VPYLEVLERVLPAAVMTTRPRKALLVVAASAIIWACCEAQKDERQDLLKLMRSRRPRVADVNADSANHVSQPHGQDETRVADDISPLTKRSFVCKFTSQRGRNALITKSETFNDDLANTYNIIGGIMSDDDLNMIMSARSEDIGIEKCEPDFEMSLMDEMGDVYATAENRHTSSTSLNATVDGQQEDGRYVRRGRKLNSNEPTPRSHSTPKLTETETALNMIRVMDGTKRIVMQGRHEVKVCVPDTGYSLGHSGLPYSRSQVTGSDTLHHRNTQTTADDSLYKWDEDANGHGTHIAGILSAIDNGDGQKVAGIGQFDLVVTRALNDKRSAGSLLDVMTSIHQCLEADADIINLSLGCWSCPLPRELVGKVGCCQENEVTIFQDFIDTVAQRSLVVAAAGNVIFEDFAGGHYIPASFGSVVGVGTITDGYTPAKFSNRNSQIEFVSPGVNIPSTDVCTPDECTYRFRSGTSMSAAYVSGAAAMLLSHNPTCSSTEIRNCLAKTSRVCDGIENKSDEERCTYRTCDSSGTWGYGLVDTARALSLLQEYGCDCGGNVLSIGSEGVCDQYPDWEDVTNMGLMLHPANTKEPNGNVPCVQLVEKAFNHDMCKTLDFNANMVCPLQGGDARKRKGIVVKLSQSLTCNAQFESSRKYSAHVSYVRVDRAKICRTHDMRCGDESRIKHVKCNSDGYLEIDTYFYPSGEMSAAGSCRSAEKEGSNGEGYCYFRYRVRCDCPEADLCTF